MKIKIMCPNNKGKIELTKEKLEKLLNESYSEGYSDGCNSRYYWISTTSYPDINYCGSISAEKGTARCDSAITYGINASKNIVETAANINNCVANKTETIEICNVNGIGVVKTNEV